MQKYLIITLTALGVISLGGFLLYDYGQAQYQRGFNKAIGEYSAQSLKASREAKIALERQFNETNKMDITDIDRDFIMLGIMREREDR